MAYCTFPHAHQTTQGYTYGNKIDQVIHLIMIGSWSQGGELNAVFHKRIYHSELVDYIRSSFWSNVTIS